MIPNSLTRFPPPPDTGDRPVMWKNLGVIAQNANGFVEAHYELKTFHGDLDPDSEDDVRGACHGILAAVANGSHTLDVDAVYTLLRRTGGPLRVKLAGGHWGEATTVEGRM